MTAAAAFLLPGMILLPLLAALLLAVPPGGRRTASALAPWVPLPALAAALLVPPPEAISYPVLVLGLRLDLDETGRLLLGVTAVVWSIAGFHMRLARRAPNTPTDIRFVLFFLLTLTGNLGAVATRDEITFYVFFAVMTMAAFGMIAADGGERGRAAGTVYLALALFGELLVLVAFMLGSVDRSPDLIVLLLLFGLGAKLGVLPLHAALPPAYAALPPAGGAVFAGPVVAAAIAGVLRFLPLGEAAFPDLAGAMIVMGLAMVAFGGALAVLQAEPRPLLGYSTVSQMGILTVGFGMAAGGSGDWHGMVPALTLFALHHTGVKAALFLGLGAGRRDRVALVGLLLMALALVAAPATGGALAKLRLEEGVDQLAEPWAGLLHVALPLTSTVTTLYMARFVWLVWRGEGTEPGPRLPFLGLAAVGLVAPWLVVLARHPHPLELAFGGRHLWSTAWPVLLGAALAAAGWLVGRSARRPLLPTVPPGDIAVAVRWAVRWLAHPPLPELPSAEWQIGRLLAAAESAERRLRGFRVLGVVYFLLLVGLAVLTGLVAVP